MGPLNLKSAYSKRHFKFSDYTYKNLCRQNHKKTECEFETQTLLHLGCGYKITNQHLHIHPFKWSYILCGQLLDKQ